MFLLSGGKPLVTGGCLGEDEDELVLEDDIMLLALGRPLCRLDMDMGEWEMRLVLMVL